MPAWGHLAFLRLPTMARPGIGRRIDLEEEHRNLAEHSDDDQTSLVIDDSDEDDGNAAVSCNTILCRR